jgi:hypothetical protein
MSGNSNAAHESHLESIALMTRILVRRDRRELLIVIGLTSCRAAASDAARHSESAWC